MKRIILVLCGLAAMGCSRFSDANSGLLPTDGIAIQCAVKAPGLQTVAVRHIDPDGAGIQSMTLLCFDRDGSFISRVTPTVRLSNPDGESGTLSATVPQQTQIIHFVANHNFDASFNDIENLGRHEHSVILNLRSTSNRIVYWGRASSVVYDASRKATDGDLAARLAAQTVTLYRNMAKITVVPGSFFELTGMAVCNQNSFGTVAPYNPVQQSFTWDADSFYVTVPSDLSKSSDPEQVAARNEEYLFENANLTADQVYVIVSGRNAAQSQESYYRILLLDDATKEPLPIVRNHNYRILFAGPLSGGTATFAEAKTAPPVNNVWISVEQEISEVSDGVTTLAVDETVVVCKGVSEPRLQKIYFTLTGGTTAPDVRWVSNGVSSTGTFDSNSYAFDSATGRGEITIRLNAVGSGEMRTGELMIKSGKLYRTVKIISISAFRFTPCWASTNVNGQTSGAAGGQQVVLMFTIPDDFPEELLPLDVLVSANQLDAAQAQTLRVVFRQDYLLSDGSVSEQWGTDHLLEDGAPLDYKYIYTVTREKLALSHKQRIYFKTSLNVDASQLTDKIYIEHPYFEPVEKTYTFTLSPMGSIVVNGLRHDTVSGVDYLLTPPLKDEPVELSFTLAQGITAENKFLICSDCLTADGIAQSDGTIEELSSSETVNSGRVLVFTPDASLVGGTEPVTLTARLKTRWAGFSEPIRIAGVSCYKSTVFEHSSYRPFTFNATIDGASSETVLLDYSDVGTRIELALDLSGYTAEDGRTISPLGREFTCYVEAPMLRLSDLAATSIREISTGLFACTVAAYAASPRLVIPFVTRSIVNEGAVRIFADESVAGFEQQTFTLRNNRLEGALTYICQGVEKPVPAQAFVVFEREDGTRIGAVTMTADGHYSLRLRSEYSYTWTQTQLTVYYRISKGADTGLYRCSGFSLSDLSAHPNLQLEQVE